MIRDLLWACVVCGAEESIEVQDKVERCRQCGARYERGAGSEIVVTGQGSAPVAKQPREWVKQLPAPTLTGSAECHVRFATTDTPIHSFGQYFGRFESFGEPVRGTLVLNEDHVRFTSGSDLLYNVKLIDLTAIQLSSSSLQLKARRQPLLTIKFTKASPRMWDERLQMAVREAYRKAGLGDVVEFQPRVVCR